jgi:4-hydroxythreonine-4-phosphate dehydrogenase
VEVKAMTELAATAITVAITMGDPAGIGPEVVVKALSSSRLACGGRPFVIGDARVISRAAESVGIARPVRHIEEPEEADPSAGALDVLDLHNADPEAFRVGEVSAIAGRASMEAVERSAPLALAGLVSAVVNAPINKEATKAAGFEDIGHLEYYARVSGASEYATMLATGRLRVVHLTTHYSLRRACELVTRDRVLAKLLLTHRSFEAWGLRRARIGVAALNPHGGEGGLFGDEELREIEPAVELARQQGVDARGPYPADSIFNRAIDGGLDVVIAMYHDQGHIPIKVHGFAESVSVALGLPMIRTSVDHGTAFDIAGRGVADERSMVEAYNVALRIARRTWPE